MALTPQPNLIDHQELPADLPNDAIIWIESMTGGPFDPDAFDVDAVNAALKALR